MKKSILKSILRPVTFASFLMLTLFQVSCTDDDSAFTPQPELEVFAAESKNEIVNIPFFVRDWAAGMPAHDNDLLFESRLQKPVYAPDGHHVTFGEWNAVRGSVDVSCTEAGVKAYVILSGLIPNAVYTMWNVSVKDPGFDPGAEMFNITGIGAAGKGDGSDNKFVASPDGKAQITMVSKGGPLSMFGEMSDCPLTDQFEWHIVGAIHLDGQTYGPDLGPDGTVAEQFGFIFSEKG